MVSKRKLVERLILQEFRHVIDFLMHNAGIRSNFVFRSERVKHYTLSAH